MKEEQRSALRVKARSKGVPEHMIDHFVGYVIDRTPPGDFMFAVLSNNLRDSFAQADEVNRHAMFDIVNFLYNDVPGCCWGSPEAVEAWVEGAD